MSSLDGLEIEEDLIDADWTERLIDTIQGRPALYDRTLKVHSDRNVISQLWTEVGEIMIESWDDLTQHERALKTREIQQRWRNLRTCFSRELRKQMKPVPGQDAKKRRKYLYFDRLLFLLPCIEERDNTGSSSLLNVIKVTNDYEVSNSSTRLSNEQDDNETSDDEQYQETIEFKTQQSIEETKEEHQDEEEEYATTEPRAPKTRPRLGSPKRKRHNKETAYEQVLLKIAEERNSSEIDEDKFFLLSLVPALKKMTDDQKIQTKIDFLAAIRRVVQNNSKSSS